MMPVKPQISKFQAEKSYQEHFNVLSRLYLQSFVNGRTPLREHVVQQVGNLFTAGWRLVAQQDSRSAY
jgi:hypothetical protein